MRSKNGLKVRSALAQVRPAPTPESAGAARRRAASPDPQSLRRGRAERNMPLPMARSAPGRIEFEHLGGHGDALPLGKVDDAPVALANHLPELDVLEQGGASVLKNAWFVRRSKRLETVRTDLATSHNSGRYVLVSFKNFSLSTNTFDF